MLKRHPKVTKVTKENGQVVYEIHNYPPKPDHTDEYLGFGCLGCLGFGCLAIIVLCVIGCYMLLKTIFG